MKYAHLLPIYDGKGRQVSESVHRQSFDLQKSRVRRKNGTPFWNFAGLNTDIVYPNG
jgi:hypothetical protein